MTGTGARSSRSRGEAAAPVWSASVRGVRPLAAERTSGAGSAIRGVLMAQPLLGQLLAYAVDVEGELAGLQARAPPPPGARAPRWPAAPVRPRRGAPPRRRRRRRRP